MSNRTHYLPKLGPPLDDGNWVGVAARDFNRPAYCGRFDWKATTSNPADVDCRDCLTKMKNNTNPVRALDPSLVP